jgi:branched-chain amino acid transport system ATP-binding protein
VALLELEEVTKRYGQLLVTDRVSLHVDEGALVGMVGPNGAGKTTLFGIVSGDVRPDVGRVVFGGATLNRLGPAARCRLGIGRTYQVPRPFGGMTVFENVLMATQQGGRLRGRESRLAAANVLGHTGLQNLANRPAETLGLLGRKRLEVARALATRPRLLLLDEVAGGLTVPEVEELMGVVRAIRSEGVAIIWIEHVVRALVGTVDRLVCLASGRIVADGAPVAVLSDPAVREVYLGTDVAADAGFHQ